MVTYDPTPTTPQRTKCEIYTRVMGYYRPVSQYNIGKKAEFYSRTYFDPLQTHQETLVSSSPCLSDDYKK